MPIPLPNSEEFEAELVDLTPEEELGHARLMNYVFPEYSHQSWAKKLKNNGLSLDALAQMYAEALQDVHPAVKLRAIERMLTITGVDAKLDVQKEVAKAAPQINLFIGNESGSSIVEMISSNRRKIHTITEKQLEGK